MKTSLTLKSSIRLKGNFQYCSIPATHRSPSKMKIFEIVRKNYAYLGITSTQSIQSHRFNQQITAALIIIGIATFLHVMHIIHVANNLKEYIESVTTTCGSSIISISFLTIVFKMETVFDCITSFESLVSMRKQIQI